MASYKSYIDACTTLMDEMNSASFDVAKANIENDSKDILKILDSIKIEFSTIFENNKNIDESDKKRFIELVDENEKEISNKCDNIVSIKTHVCNWYIDHNDKIRDKQKKVSEEYHDLCLWHVGLRLLISGVFFLISLGLAILSFCFSTSKLFDLLNSTMENMETMGEFCFYFKVIFWTLILIITIVCSFKFLPKMYKQTDRLITLLSMIYTDSLSSRTNIQRELELIMKS